MQSAFVIFWDRECQDTLCNTSEYQMVLYRSFMYRRVPWNQIMFMWYGSWSPPDVLTNPDKVCDMELLLPNDLLFPINNVN